MANFTLHIPKTCTAVRVEEADGEFIVRLELPDYPSQVATASEARATAAGLSSEERKRAANAARQKRYRDRKRNADRNASVTNVTQTVTPSVTHNADIVCMDDCIINDINYTQERNKQEKNHPINQKSVARSVTPVTHNAQDRVRLQLGLPMVPEIEDFPRLLAPEVIDRWKRYVLWRQAKGAYYIQYTHLREMLEMMNFAMETGGAPAVLQLLDCSQKEGLINVLQPPPPAPEPEEPTPAIVYFQGGKSDDMAEVERLLALGRGQWTTPNRS